MFICSIYLCQISLWRINYYMSAINWLISIGSYQLTHINCSNQSGIYTSKEFQNMESLTHLFRLIFHMQILQLQKLLNDMCYGFILSLLCFHPFLKQQAGGGMPQIYYYG